MRRQPCDRHSSWPGIAARLGATYPPALRAASILAYLVLLRVEIARFTRSRRLRLRSRKVLKPRTFDRLVSVALILGSRRAAVSCYAALCSPDLPPVPCFHARTSGGLACFTTTLSVKSDANGLTRQMTG